MMSFVLILLGSLGIVQGVWTNALWMVAACSSCLVLYLIVILIDCIRLAAVATSLGANEKQVVRVCSFFTVVGEDLANRLLVCQDRLRSQEWEISAFTQTARKRNARTLFEESADREELEGNYFQSILRRIAPQFRCSCSAIVCAVGDEPLSVVKIGIFGDRLDGRLKSVARRHLQNGGAQQVLIIDEVLNNSLGSGFSEFGIRYSIIADFEENSANGKIKGVLWLGYVAGKRPSGMEVERAREIIGAIRAEVAARTSIRHLSSKVNEAESLNREKNELIAHMSHDIRTPLGNIRTILNLFKLEGLKEDSPELIEVALKNCENLSEIVDDLLDYSRHRMGKLTTNPREIDFVDLVREVYEGFLVAAKIKGLNYEIVVEHEGVAIIGDRSQLKRVISNLISNAIKYTEHGGVRIRLTEEHEGYCRLIVQDTGVGLNSAQMNCLFTPFTRFHAVSSEGVGLGLAISKILVGLNEGEMKVESVEGQGSEFQIRFPLVVKPQGLIDGTVKKLAFSPESKMRVLVIDDDIDCVDALKRALEISGYEVVSAIWTSEALALINFEKPDVIITDNYMPDGGGKRVLEYVHQHWPAIPVLVLSGHEGEEQQYLALGAAKMMLKPADVAEITTWLAAMAIGHQNEETSMVA